MKSNFLLLTLCIILSAIGSSEASNPETIKKKFNPKKDLLLVQMDCKTDVDDIHTLAALVTLLSDEKLSNVNFHAVAGTYGIQEGLYVPPNPLFELALGNNWSDAHADVEKAAERVSLLVLQTLADKGHIWIADAGQSDFSARVIRIVEQEMPDLEIADKIHVVQHSNWNEEVTDPDALAYVKSTADYHKIPDGNAVGNGTPGFRTPEFSNWKDELSDPRLIEIWQLAVNLGNKYNGKEGRYNNEAVEAGGLDFSDLSEVCYILDLDDIKDTQEFFDRYGR